jgi:hypothetical protein
MLFFFSIFQFVDKITTKKKQQSRLWPDCRKKIENNTEIYTFNQTPIKCQMYLFKIICWTD